MSTADKVALVNTLNGANLSAFAAIYAKLVVYYGKVVNNLDCAGGTGFFALHTADTAV